MWPILCLRKAVWFHPWISPSFCCVHQLHKIGQAGEHLKEKLNCAGAEPEVSPWFISLWTYQAGWEYPKKCHDCQAGKRHESRINATNSEVALLFQIVVSLLQGWCHWNIHRIKPSNVCILSHLSAIIIWKSANFKGKFPKRTLLSALCHHQ